MSGGAARLASLTVLLASVPLTIRYLGAERYGVWATIVSLVSLLQFSDLGVGNGLITALADANGRRDQDDARVLVSSALVMLAMTGALLCVTFLVLSSFVSWPDFFRVTSQTAAVEVAPACAVLTGALAIGLPVGVGQYVQIGYQEGFFNHGWEALGSLMALAGIAVAAFLHAPVPYLVLALTGGPLLALAANDYVLFTRRRPLVRPRARSIEAPAFKRLVRLGGLFFGLQLAGAVGFSSDNLVIARVLGPEAVTNYAVPFRLFSVIAAVSSLACAPLWPAYGEAIASRDVRWVRRTLRRSLLLVAGWTAPAALVLTLCGPVVIRVWAGKDVHTTWPLLAGLAVWSVMSSLGITLAMFLNAMVIVRLQLVAALTMAVSNVVMSVYLANHVGIAGVIWGTVVSYGVCVVVPFLVLVPRIVRRLDPSTASAIS